MKESDLNMADKKTSTPMTKMEKSDKLFKEIERAIKKEHTNEVLEEELDTIFGETCAVLVLDATGFTRITQAYGTPFSFQLSLKCGMFVQKYLNEQTL